MSTSAAKKKAAEAAGPDVRIEVVNLKMMKEPPADYHCRCRFCVSGFRGVLVRKDGSPYSRLDRNKYYSPVERIKTGKEKDSAGHISKTPLHVARWAIQAFSKPGDWVMDPTMGAGTTAVEALNHGRNVFGVEIQYIDVIQANIEHALLSPPAGTPPVKYSILHGDARAMTDHLNSLPRSIQFSLIVNNPPYSGDQRAQTDNKAGKDPKDEDGRSKKMYTVGYSKEFDNLAFLKEGPAYWEEMKDIYTTCIHRLLPGGHFVVGVKDMMRDKKSDELHRKFAEVLEQIPGMTFKGVVALPHYPKTLHMNTYAQWHPGTPLAMHQSIIVFRKEAA